jgi:serine/threonine protein kinase
MIVKLHDPKWIAVAAKEWSHGAAIGHHDCIVDHVEVFMHRDQSGLLQKKLEQGFATGALAGERPKTFPEHYFCMVLEDMDCGTLQSLMGVGPVGAQGIATVTEAVASALNYMHCAGIVHNDIRPHNVLLKRARSGHHLLPKLADLGSAASSADRHKDCDRLAYTIWCMGLATEFLHPPSPEGRPAAINEFRKACQAGYDSLWVAMSEIIADLWSGQKTMLEVAQSPAIQGHSLVEPTSRPTAGRLEQSAWDEARGAQDVDWAKRAHGSDSWRRDITEGAPETQDRPFTCSPPGRGPTPFECEPEPSPLCDDVAADSAGSLVEALSKRTLELQKLDQQLALQAACHAEYCRRIATSSAASSALADAVDLQRAQLVGRWGYGYVLRTTCKASQKHVMLRLQDPRQIHKCVREWTWGSSPYRHEHILEHLGVYLHRDADETIKRRLMADFDSGTLMGARRPWDCPASYFCLLFEHIDGGTVQSLVELGSITFEGVAAITRSIASALAFLHQMHRAHGDVTLENMFLTRAGAEPNSLIAKLADPMLIDHDQASARKRDFHLFGCSICCMGIKRASFPNIPEQTEMDSWLADLAAIRELESDEECKLRGALVNVVSSLWLGNVAMTEVERTPELQGFSVRAPARHPVSNETAIDDHLRKCGMALLCSSSFSSAIDTDERPPHSEDPTMVQEAASVSIVRCLSAAFSRKLVVTAGQAHEVCDTGDKRTIAVEVIEQYETNTNERSAGARCRHLDGFREVASPDGPMYVCDSCGERIAIDEDDQSRVTLASQLKPRASIGAHCRHLDGFREEVGSDGRTYSVCDTCGERIAVGEEADPAAAAVNKRKSRASEGAYCLHLDGLRDEISLDGRTYAVCDTCGERVAAEQEAVASVTKREDCPSGAYCLHLMGFATKPAPMVGRMQFVTLAVCALQLTKRMGM